MKYKNLKKQFAKKILSSAICGLSLSLLTQTAGAQIGSASLHGVVALHELPQPGLEVIAKDIQNGYTFRAITQKDGTYVFNGLRPGNYQVYIQEKSGKNPDPIQLKVGQSLNLDFQLDKNTNADNVDEVVVIGSELKSNSNGGEIGTTVSLEQISKLPQNTRNFLAFADMAPGVQFTQASDGSTKIKGGAQSANSINVFIDGVGQKNYVLGGGITGQDSSHGNPFPQSAISQYKVITQNYSAEYDQLSSAAIVAVTASGTNEFHGSMFYDYTDQGMREARPSEVITNEKVPSKQGQYGFSVGGPIIQDKMHFFFAYEAKNNADPKDVIPQGGESAAKLPTEYLAMVGGVSQKFQEDLYFGKIDYLLSDEQKLELTAKIRKENELTGLGGVNTRSYGTDKKNDETRIDLNHNWRTGSWLNDVHLTYEDASYNPRPHTLGNGLVLENSESQTILNVGGGRDYQDKGQKGWSLQEDFSYLAIDSHILKTGFKYKLIDLNAVEQQPYNPQYHYNIDYSATQPYSVEWGAPLANYGDGGLQSNNKQLGVYVQDDWSATDQLTVNLGLRWDYEESDAYLHYKTPDYVLAGIASWDGIKKSNININDYISDGRNRESFKNAWQPRLGFTYKLDDDHNTELFGGLGRAYDRNLFDYLQVETTSATFPNYTIYFNSTDPKHGCDLNDANCKQWDAKYLTAAGLSELASGNPGAGREIDMLSNKLKTPYSDQFSFGIRGSLDNQWNAEVSLSHVVSKDGFVWMLANRHDDGSFFPNPQATWGQPWGLGIPGLGNTYIGINGLETKANSLFIKLDKPRAESNWSTSIAYTYTVAKTNREDGEHYAQDYPSMSGYGMKDSNRVPQHRLVISALVGLPGDIDFAVKFNLQSVESYYGLNCRPGWDHCRWQPFKPDTGFLGYKQVDVTFSKNIPTNFISEGSNLIARLDILNLTNSINPDGYQNWYGSPDAADPNFGKPNNELAGPPLTLKAGLTWNW